MDSKPRFLRVSFPEWKRPMRRWTLTNDHPVGESRRYVCCDCGLAHDLEIKRHIQSGGYVLRWWRNDHSTAQYRRSREYAMKLKSHP